MNLLRANLLAASALAAVTATAAQAQVTLPQVELRGAGATSVADVLPRTLNCVGRPGAGQNQYGTNSGTLATVEPGHYNPTAPTATDPAYDCATQEIQPNFEGKYIGTGSGAGRQMWRTFTTSNLNGTAGNINPFSGGAGNPSGWTNLQFAFSDAPLPASELTTYNSTANNATNGAGAAIQIPLFVLPVAFAYNAAYGVRTTGGGASNLYFDVKFPASINGVVAGGLRLNRDAYCKIFNGEITNWNDPAIKALNGGQVLFDKNNDNGTRWANEGVPIRLVGRADRSGTTDIFTRAIAAQCDGFVAVNKFDKAAESLPYDNTSTIDIRPLRSDTRYFPAAAASNFSGTVQSIGGRVFDRQNDVICNWDEVNASTTRCDTALAPGGVFTNSATPGLFLLADGSSGVEEAIRTTVNNTMLQSSQAAIKLNGKFGYVGADLVAGSLGRTLHSAALQRGTTTQWSMPSASEASKAFGSVLPPQTTSTLGTWNTSDARTLGANDPYLAISDPVNGGASVPVSRSNPLHWAAVLYNPNVPITSTLAYPAAGYPVTGTTFLLTYTCFKPANAAVPGNNAGRFAVAEYLGLMFGKITKDNAGNPVSASVFAGTGATNLGVVAQSNIALPTRAWVNAIANTYLYDSAQASGGSTLGDQNLWIQNGFPTTAPDVNNVVNPGDQDSNPSCDATKGA